MSADIRRTATISECGKYRYHLARIWAEGPSHTGLQHLWQPRELIFVMLNPSTADAYEDDPTIRRCIGFAKRDDYDSVGVMNLYAGRATKPNDLFTMNDPEGPENEYHWEKLKKSAATIICAWGAEKRAQKQAKKFIRFMEGRELHCLGRTKAGSPKHPLYLKAETSVEPFAATQPQGQGK